MQTLHTAYNTVESPVSYLYLYLLGWHTLPSHASDEACLKGWPNVQPQGTSVVLCDTIRLTGWCV